MLHKVLGRRAVKIFGRSVFELPVAYYDLLLGGVKNPAFTYHKISELKNFPFTLKDFAEFAGRSDENFIVVADTANYAEIREVLIRNGYEPLKDFVQFKPTPYTKVWRE